MEFYNKYAVDIDHHFASVNIFIFWPISRHNQRHVKRRSLYFMKQQYFTAKEHKQSKITIFGN